MAGMHGQCGGRDCQDRAPGMGQAVAAHPAAEGTSQCGAAACPDDEQVARVAGDDGKNAAGIAALDHGLDRQISGQLPPGGVKRLPQPLPGVFGPDAAQVHAGTAPFGDVAARRRPGMNGYQGGFAGTGKLLGVAQGAQVTPLVPTMTRCGPDTAALLPHAVSC